MKSIVSLFLIGGLGGSLAFASVGQGDRLLRDYVLGQCHELIEVWYENGERHTRKVTIETESLRCVALPTEEASASAKTDYVGACSVFDDQGWPYAISVITGPAGLRLGITALVRED